MFDFCSGLICLPNPVVSASALLVSLGAACLVVADFSASLLLMGVVFSTLGVAVAGIVIAGATFTALVAGTGAGVALVVGVMACKCLASSCVAKSVFGWLLVLVVVSVTGALAGATGACVVDGLALSVLGLAVCIQE